MPRCKTNFVTIHVSYICLIHAIALSAGCHNCGTSAIKVDDVSPVNQQIRDDEVTPLLINRSFKLSGVFNIDYQKDMKSSLLVLSLPRPTFHFNYLLFLS